MPSAARAASPPDWPLDVFNTLKRCGVAQLSYVPDAGHARLINLAHDDEAIKTTVLTTEEEGIALCAGAWIGGDSFGSLDRRDAIKTLLADRKDLLVVTGLGSPSYDVFAAGEHDGNFYLWGAMDGAAMVGLGLALAQPERPVVVVTGDGEQMMGLGSLLTVAVRKPGNLTVAVLDNGHFGETGMQLSHSGHGVRLGVIADGAGFPSVTEIVDLNGIAD